MCTALGNPLKTTILLDINNTYLIFIVSISVDLNYLAAFVVGT